MKQSRELKAWGRDGGYMIEIESLLLLFTKRKLTFSSPEFRTVVLSAIGHVQARQRDDPTKYTRFMVPSDPILDNAT
ncbi:hypothetical protein BT69DRAFT_1287004 [Atractiella rhizophila]|nr:hypothetical protein BT69DRAFT_1287004 [Atractiella rhizophila]